MTSEWEQVVIDSADPVALGRWWTEALGWVVLNDAPDEYEIRPAPDRTPGLVFVPVPEVSRSEDVTTETAKRPRLRPLLT